MMRSRTREALQLAHDAFATHDLWCGYNPDAPGNGTIVRAMAAVDDALALAARRRLRLLILLVSGAVSVVLSFVALVLV